MLSSRNLFFSLAGHIVLYGDRTIKRDILEEKVYFFNLTYIPDDIDLTLSAVISAFGFVLVKIHQKIDKKLHKILATDSLLVN